MIAFNGLFRSTLSTHVAAVIMLNTLTKESVNCLNFEIVFHVTLVQHKKKLHLGI
jgi:hypothetical protein